MQNTHIGNRNSSVHTSRRSFLNHGLKTFFLIGAMTGAGISAFGQDAKRRDPIELPKTFDLVRSKFEPHLSEYFTANINGEAIHFQLIEVADLQRDSIAKSAENKMHSEKFRQKVREESFALTFRTSTEIELRQMTYRLNHETLGKIELFLVPVGRKDGPWRFYEAVFNRLQE